MSKRIKVRHYDGAEDEAAEHELGIWIRGGWTPVDDESDTAESESRSGRAQKRSGVPDDLDEE